MGNKNTSIDWKTKIIMSYNLLLTVMVAAVLVSCQADVTKTKQKATAEQFAPKLDIQDVKKGIADDFEVYKLIPVNFDEDRLAEYLAIIRPKPFLNSVVDPIGDVYVLAYDYEESWRVMDSFNLNKPFIKEEFEITDFDSNGISEIHLEGWYVYANGQSESEIFILTNQDGKIQNACEYIGKYHDLFYDKDSGTINTVDWIRGAGYWTCHYFKCTTHKLINGQYMPVQERKSSRKYTFDNIYDRCTQYSTDLIKKEFGLN